MKLVMHNWIHPEPIETTLGRLPRYDCEGIEIWAEPARAWGQVLHLSKSSRPRCEAEVCAIARPDPFDT